MPLSQSSVHRELQVPRQYKLIFTVHSRPGIPTLRLLSFYIPSSPSPSRPPQPLHLSPHHSSGPLFTLASDPPLPFPVSACADSQERCLLTQLSSRRRPSAGGGALWEKMAAAVHPRVARALPMSRKCHRERRPRIGSPRCGSKVLGVAPWCSGHAESLGTLVFLGPELPLSSSSFFSPSPAHVLNCAPGKGSSLGEREQREGERKKGDM